MPHSFALFCGSMPSMLLVECLCCSLASLFMLQIASSMPDQILSWLSAPHTGSFKELDKFQVFKVCTQSKAPK